MENYVSVIIPTYNRARLLRKAVDSVLAQSHRNFELIIVDDGSDDGTADLLDKYGSDIIYIRQENSGPAAARNRGIARASYEFLAFLDSDDLFVERKLEIQLEAMSRNPSYLISHTDETWYRKGKILNQKKIHRKNSGDIFNQSLRLCAVGMSTVMVRRDIFDRYGLFDQSYPCCEDYEFWLRVSAEQRFLLVREPLTIKNGGRDDQVSAIHRTGMDRYRIQAILKLLAAGGLTEDRTTAALQELERKCTIYGTGCVKHGRKEEGYYYLNLPETINKNRDVL